MVRYIKSSMMNPEMKTYEDHIAEHSWCVCYEAFWDNEIEDRSVSVLADNAEDAKNYVCIKYHIPMDRIYKVFQEY